MDAYPAIESIVHLMTSLPDESVESLLVTLDALVGVSDEGLRPSTAQLLRNTAESCPDAARCARLLRAAGAVAAGEPCALTPDGLTWKQAASAQTVTQAERDERIAQTPLPPCPASQPSPRTKNRPSCCICGSATFSRGLWCGWDATLPMPTDEPCARAIC
jgi:hypothetical protein